MTISPPQAPAKTSGLAAQTVGEEQRNRERLARDQAYMASPEGQAKALADKLRNDEALKVMDALLAQDEDSQDGLSGPSKHKKHGKLFSKHPPKKGAGGVLSVLDKLKKKR